MHAVGAFGGPVSCGVDELRARVCLTRAIERVVVLVRIRGAERHTIVRGRVQAEGPHHMPVVPQPEQALGRGIRLRQLEAVVVLADGDRAIERQHAVRRHRSERRHAIAVARRDVEMPHARVLADRRQLELAVFDALASPLRVLELGSEREPPTPDRIEGHADDVIGRRFEDAVRALILQPRVADARRGKAQGGHSEVRVQRIAQHTEWLGMRGGGYHGRRRVVVGDPLAHGEHRRAVVVVVGPIAHVQVHVPRWPRHERQVDRRRARLAVDAIPLQWSGRVCRVDRLGHQRIPRVLQLPHRDVRGRPRSRRHLDRRHAVDRKERVARRQRVAPSRGGRRNVGQAERIVVGDRGVLVVEERAGVAGPEHDGPARVLRACIDVGQPMIDRRGQLHETAVAEASAVGKRALPVGVLHLAFDGQLRGRDVLEAAAPDVSPGVGGELDGVADERSARGHPARPAPAPAGYP